MRKKPTQGPKRTSSGKAIPSAPQRAVYALSLFNQGMRYCGVREAIMVKFTVARATAEADIKEAYKSIAEEAEKELPQLASRISARLWRLAASAEADGEYAAAVQALGRLAKLHGLEAAKRIHHSGELTEDQRAMLQSLTMTPIQRAERLRELEAAGQ